MKNLILKIATAVVLAGVVVFAASAQNKKTLKKPNIILILADDLGVGDVGCYGQQKIATPNIDLLAKQGMRFRQFYAGTSVCAPSRASLMTGLHTGHTVVRGNRGFEPEGQYPLADTSLTIAKVLQSSGYETADFGKWGLGYPGSTGVPLKQGFNTFFGYNCQSLAHSYYPDHLWQNNDRLELPANVGKDSVYSADFIHEHSMNFLQQTHTQPFFIWLSYTLPHAALSVPHDAVYEAYVKQFGESPQNKDSVKAYENAAFEPYPHAAYAAMVSRLDKYVGEVMAEVKKQGIEDNTIIMFSSDNGPHKEGHNDPDFFNSSANLKGIKRDLYEGGIRVPFVVQWKGVVKPGTTNNIPGAFWDLFPTFQQVAGLPVATNIDGLSLFNALKGKPVEHEYLYWEFHENNGRQAVRYKKWKGVKLNVSTLPNAPLELYDLNADPYEKNNVATQHKDIVEKIEAYMKAAHKADVNWPLLYEEVAASKK